MNKLVSPEVITALTEKACASIRYRTRKEILGDNPDIKEYLDEILDDKRVKYVFSWQKADGFLGQSFHGGWIPDAKLKFYNTGAEPALRFMSEMGIPVNYTVVEKGLNALLKNNWCPDPWKWFTVYEPEIGLFGADHVRAVVFAYFGIEENDFIQIETQRTYDRISRVTEIASIDDITGTYRNKLYFNGNNMLPDLYDLKLLAFTQSWRNSNNTNTIAEALKHLILLSPLPQIYIKCGSQLVAPAMIQTQVLKKTINDLDINEWYWWLQYLEIFSRMGVAVKVPFISQQVKELKEQLLKNDGFSPFKPLSGYFQKWNAYSGLALESNWKQERWKFDLTFRCLLILKYSGLLEEGS